MFRIVDARQLASDVKWFRIDAPLVARRRRVGQFAIIRLDETGERIPLTIADYDRAAGTITVVFMEAGKTSTKLAQLQAGDSLATFVGPLGLATEVDVTANATLQAFEHGLIFEIRKQVFMLVESSSTWEQIK